MKNINSKTLELEMTLQCHFQQSQLICYMGFKNDRKGVKFIYAFPEIWTSWLNLQNCYIFTSLGQKTETIGNIPWDALCLLFSKQWGNTNGKGFIA